MQRHKEMKIVSVGKFQLRLALRLRIFAPLR